MERFQGGIDANRDKIPDKRPAENAHQGIRGRYLRGSAWIVGWSRLLNLTRLRGSEGKIYRNNQDDSRPQPLLVYLPHLAHRCGRGGVGSSKQSVDSKTMPAATQPVAAVCFVRLSLEGRTDEREFAP